MLQQGSSQGPLKAGSDVGCLLPCAATYSLVVTLLFQLLLLLRTLLNLLLWWLLQLLLRPVPVLRSDASLAFILALADLSCASLPGKKNANEKWTSPPGVCSLAKCMLTSLALKWVCVHPECTWRERLSLSLQPLW